jgi:hypothetical protein
MSSPPSKAGPEAWDRNYKAFVGPVEEYDRLGAMQFNLLTALGLRQDHMLLDIGCGSLRAGKLFVPYLLPDRYFGIEPEQWLIEEGLRHELGHDILKVKRPRFDNNAALRLNVFDQQFDYIIVHTVFSHAAPGQLRTYFGSCQVMKPTSILVGSYVAGEEDYQGDAWVYPERVTYTCGFVTASALQAGLVYVPIDWSHPTGQAWFAAVHPGSEDLVRQLSGDPFGLPILKARLSATEDRLQRTRQHPYVRFGLWVRGLLRGGSNRGNHKLLR